jgi:hypothetical protein
MSTEGVGTCTPNWSSNTAAAKDRTPNRLIAAGRLGRRNLAQGYWPRQRLCLRRSGKRVRKLRQWPAKWTCFDFACFQAVPSSRPSSSAGPFDYSASDGGLAPGGDPNKVGGGAGGDKTGVDRHVYNLETVVGPIERLLRTVGMKGGDSSVAPAGFQNPVG